MSVKLTETHLLLFKDIYDVLNNIFMEEIEKNLREAGSNGSVL